MEEKKLESYKNMILNEIKRLKLSDDTDIFQQSVKEEIKEMVQSILQGETEKLKQFNGSKILDNMEEILENYDLLFEKSYEDFLEKNGTKISMKKIQNYSQELSKQIQEIKSKMPKKEDEENNGRKDFAKRVQATPKTIDLIDISRNSYYGKNSEKSLMEDDEWQK